VRLVLAGTFTGHGGIQTHLRSLARVLADAEHDLLLLSFGGHPDAGDRVRNNFSTINSRVRLKYLCGSISGRTAVGTFLAIQRALRNFHPDVYFACGTGWNLFAPAVFRHHRCRFIFHEVMSGEPAGWRDSRWLVRRAFDFVVAQASPVARNFERTFGWHRPIPVIPAFAAPLEKTSRIPLVQQHRMPFGTARAAIFGRLVSHKRVAWLVGQWPRLNRSLRELHIFGTGPEEAAIRKLIFENGWSDSVFCHGSYPDAQAYVDLLSGFDLTLMPTIGAEGAPLVLLESMACGVPFVATDAGGISDYANTDCLIVPRDDPESFLLGIQELSRRLAEGTIDHRRLQDFYRSRFSFDVLKREWLSFFESMATP
jgi:glycosyltransferase involved in cell wall biosynthesis